MFFAPTLRTRAFVAPRTLDRNFERFVHEAFVGTRQPVDVQQDDAGWTLRVDVPGVAREQLSIGIEGAVVRIETQADAPRQFKAAYELPQDIDAAASEAKLENGVLTLKLGKLAPVSKVVALTIQ